MNHAFRKACQTDLVDIIRLLADDDIGQGREVVADPVDRRYQTAFDAIDADKNQLLAVAVDQKHHVVGCLQVSFIPGLSRTGTWRGQIESVRIARQARGSGLGTEFIEWAIETCRARGCKIVQLTSDKSRAGSIRFYEKLGFAASHEGLKLSL